MIHTDEDDEFERILRENRMKGQPYHWEAEAIKSAINIEREECARIVEIEAMQYAEPVWAIKIVNAIRNRGLA